MNKTININLASTFFHIDENAYTLLKSYLNKLENAFKKTTGKEEILSDIELRIAELFQERKKHPAYVINASDVGEVIEILGQPEDFVSEEDANAVIQIKTISRKLFRDPDDRYIGGVASGLGYFFGINTTWIRILWLIFGLFSVGTITLIYLILWITIPEAKTTADKLRMKGEPINIATIEKKIKEEFDDVSSKIKDIDYGEVKSSLKKKSTTFFSFLEGVLSLIPKVIIKILGVLFLIISTFGIFGVLLGIVLFFIFGVLEWPFNFYFNFFEFNPYPNIAISLAVFFLIIIPFIFLFSLGIRFLNKRSTIFGTSRIILIGLWILALVGIITFGINELHNHSVSATKTEKHELNLSQTDTLYLSLGDKIIGFEDDLWEYDELETFPDELGKNWSVGENFNLNIVKTDNSTSYFEVKYEADGANQKKAQENAKEIQYAWKKNGKSLILDPVWKLKTSARFQNQSVHLKLHLTEGQIIAIDQSLEKILAYPVKNDQGFYSNRTAGKLWKMGREELICLSCEENKTELNINYKSKDEKDKLRLDVDTQGIKIKTK